MHGSGRGARQISSRVRRLDGEPAAKIESVRRCPDWMDMRRACLPNVATLPKCLFARLSDRGNAHHLHKSNTDAQCVGVQSETHFTFSLQHAFSGKMSQPRRKRAILHPGRRHDPCRPNISRKLIKIAELMLRDCHEHVRGASAIK